MASMIFKDLESIFHLYFVEAKLLSNDKGMISQLYMFWLVAYITHDLCLDQNHDPLEIIQKPTNVPISYIASISN